MLEFKTCISLKPYNHKKYWIDSDMIPDYRSVKTFKEALQDYRDFVKCHGFIDISDTALKHPDPIYIDKADGSAIQCGIILTGSTEIEGSKQYVDLWIDVLESEYYFAKEA